MTTFTYRAMTRDGRIVEGALDAVSGEEVRRRLEYLDLLPIEMAAGRPRTWISLLRRRSIPADVVTDFTRDLAFMLESGFRIEQALDMMADPHMSNSLAATVKSLAASVRTGESFATALERFDTIFPPLYVAIVKIGESSGQLAVEMRILANLRGKMEATRNRVLEQLRYPAFILLLAATVLVFFLRMVLPQFATTLRELGGRMDGMTSILLGISDFVTESGTTLFFALLAAIMIAASFLRSVRGRIMRRQILHRLPIVRDLVAEYQTAIFCRALGHLLQHGMSLSKALTLAAGALTGGAPNEVWSESLSKIRHGGTLASALAENDDVTALARRMLTLGEQAGRVGTVALQAADLFDLRLERGLRRIVGFAGPAAIVVISLLVGLLVVTLMNALMAVGQLAN